jgi:hypothetical protein
MEVSGQLHAPTALLPGKEPWYPLDRGLGGPQSRSGRGGEEKNSCTLSELSSSPILYEYGLPNFKFHLNPSSSFAANWTPVVQPVAQSVYWVSYPDSQIIGIWYKI